jgi:uncharacterized membrane protein YcgQ (UPF0703/DUF1980 family)
MGMPQSGRMESDMIKRKGYLILLIMLLVIISGVSGCSKRLSATQNGRMNAAASDSDNAGDNAAPEEQSDTSEDALAEDDPEYQAFLDSKAQDASQEAAEDSGGEKDFGTPDAAGRVGYNFDIEEDKKAFDGEADIVVGDNLYTTQINDWYTNFDQYEGKTVEIEGYYINDYAPYTFVGRYGPSCPFCNGGYVSFEFYTQDDLSALKSVQDWIKIKGILRQGEDSSGIFYYIEVLSLEKMDEVGKDTVTN